MPPALVPLVMSVLPWVGIGLGTHLHCCLETSTSLVLDAASQDAGSQGTWWPDIYSVLYCVLALGPRSQRQACLARGWHMCLLMLVMRPGGCHPPEPLHVLGQALLCQAMILRASLPPRWKRQGMFSVTCAMWSPGGAGLLLSFLQVPAPGPHPLGQE